MFKGPEQVPSDSDDSGWASFKDHSNSKSGESQFKYNPNEQTPSSSSFPETDDVEAPEKG
jgi:hypothetical protein